MQFGWPLRDRVSLAKRVEAVQMILPIERRRIIRHIGNVDRVKETLELWARKKNSPSDPPAPAVVLPTPAPTPTSAPSVSASTGLEELLGDWIKKLIREVLAEQKEPKFVNHVVSPEVFKFIPGMPKHDPTPKGEPRHDKPRVLVCGMLPSQQPIFLETYQDLHLRFWFAEKSSGGLVNLKDKIEWAQEIVCKLDQVGHAATGMMKNAGKKPMLVDGSVSGMHTALARISKRFEGA